MSIKQEILRMSCTRFLDDRLNAPLVILVLTLAATATSNAAETWTQYVYTSIASAYRDCVYQDLGNQTSRFSVTYELRAVSQIAEVMNRVNSLDKIWTRGLMIYAYDKNGKLEQHSNNTASSISMNGTRYSIVLPYVGMNYLYSGESTGGSWINRSAHSARVDVIIPNVYLQGWPAIGVRTALESRLFTWLDDKIISVGAADTPGNCSIIDPTKPPPTDAKIIMTAPDWKLGELSPGETRETSFHDATEQLCFTYDGQQWAGQRYAIRATNQNGLSGDGSYQLKHLASPADAVPYRVALRNALTNATVELPNTRNVVSTLGNSGRECFAPTFVVDTPKTAKEGDYSDVLTFTVVARP